MKMIEIEKLPDLFEHEKVDSNFRFEVSGFMPSTKTVSIIVAYSLSRENLLRRLLTSIDSVLKNGEVQAELLISSEGNRSECLNNLARKATGDVLIFFDDDVELRYNTIQELLQPFYSGEFKNVGVVGGVNIRFKDVTKDEEHADALLKNPITMFRSRARYTPIGDKRLTDESEIITCVLAISRKAFEEAGGFPGDIIPCEENVLINRIRAKGYSVVYNPFAVVYHRRPKLFREYARTIFNYGKGRGMMMRNHAGNPKLFPKPSWGWLVIGVGVIVHYASYISGVVYGYFKKPKKPKTV
jgi:cellulose synthase/poly-beta-1,6-N-acetylglucosamine synthase-like glycosyltransferase